MRVFVTGLRGFPSVMGGVESHAEELYPRIKARDASFDITVLARRPYVGKQSYVFEGVSIVPLVSTSAKSTEAIVGSFVATVYARYRRAQLLHIHAIGPALMAPLARLLGMKVVVTHHGEDYQRAKWGRFAKFMLRSGEKAAVTFADRIIVVAPSLREELARAYPAAKDKLVYIPNGASDLPVEGSTCADVLAKVGYAPKDYVLAVGRLVPEKAFDQLVAAIKAVPGRKLLIVGGADHASDFAKRLLALADEQVAFAGVLDKATLRDLYLNCALFVLPSLHEGLPIVALEAGSLGAPLLLSDIPANRDLGLPEANYFTTGDVAELTRKLNCPDADYALQGNPLKDRFNWDTVAQQTADLYQSIR